MNYSYIKAPINYFDLSSFFARASLFLVIITLLFFCSCGKRKIPLPPVQQTFPLIEVSGVQRGNGINIFVNIPDPNASTDDFSKVKRIDIYRLVETASDNLPLSEGEFASRSVLIATVPIVNTSNQATFVDNLEITDSLTRLRYAVRFVNADGQKTAFSNFFVIEPIINVANNPTSLSGQVLPDAIQLNWHAPSSNSNGTVPASILGYNVYKIIGDESPKLINETPVNGTKYTDKMFEFGRSYKYFVRTISLGSGGNPVESINSNVFETNAVDTFPPSAPSAITIAAAPNNLSLFFAANSESDIAGYKVYRSANPRLEKSEWTLLTVDLLTTNTFQDKNIESGKTYYYFLTAVDKQGNTSESSEIVSEKAP